MSLRTQALLCFATALAAFLVYREVPNIRYGIAVGATFIGVMLLRQDSQRRTAAARSLSRDERPAGPPEA